MSSNLLLPMITLMAMSEPESKYHYMKPGVRPKANKAKDRHNNKRIKRKEQKAARKRQRRK